MTLNNQVKMCNEAAPYGAAFLLSDAKMIDCAEALQIIA